MSSSRKRDFSTDPSPDVVRLKDANHGDWGVSGLDCCCGLNEAHEEQEELSDDLVIELGHCVVCHYYGPNS